MFIVPELGECIEFARLIGCNNIIEVPIEPREFDLPYRCHHNCLYNPLLGYYFLKDIDTGFLYAYKHSVLITDKGIIDVTPVYDNRFYNVFGYGESLNYDQESLVYLENCVFINIEKHGDQDMYYVYGLIDPRTNFPFYVGKGKGTRWQYHYSDKSILETANTEKTKIIMELKELNFTPRVIFYAQNIEDEQIAYNIEAVIIKSYGRKNYEKDGILTNITIDSRPPNWKGKTYYEIYGNERGQIIKDKKAKHQRDVGGYFRGRKHTKESKEKMSKKSSESALSEAEVLEYGKKFCEYFNGKISRSKWYWWAKKNEISPYILKQRSRFSGKCALNIFEEKFDAKIMYNQPLLWFHNPQTKKTFRCLQWELEYGAKKVPESYIKGRGTNTFSKRLENKHV